MQARLPEGKGAIQPGPRDAAAVVAAQRNSKTVVELLRRCRVPGTLPQPGHLPCGAQLGSAAKFQSRLAEGWVPPSRRSFSSATGIHAFGVPDVTGVGATFDNRVPSGRKGYPEGHTTSGAVARFWRACSHLPSETAGATRCSARANGASHRCGQTPGGVMLAHAWFYRPLENHGAVGSAILFSCPGKLPHWQVPCGPRASSHHPGAPTGSPHGQ